MCFLSWVSDNVEVVALAVSIISIGFACRFSWLQQKHNTNSVRPICNIIFNDYEDCIAVKIENVGSGPLTINRLICQNGSTNYPTLIGCMPKISQNWSDFVENIDGRTIPIGGHIVLIKLEPQDQETKEVVRRALSTIVIKVEYEDIYNNKFCEERRLDFFGRTLNH